ncbi:hypothetical protein GCM10010513_33380 [Streptomyces glebosus]|nr:hypothetical protein GCM10010513_33380 [Streptomyces glebosus]
MPDWQAPKRAPWQQRGQGERHGRVGHRGGQTHQRRTEHERHFVQGAFEGKRGVDQAVVGPGAAGEGDEPGAGQRPDLRHSGPGEQRDQGERQRAGPGERGRHQRGHGEGVEPAGGQHHRPLPVPVGEPAEQRAARRLARRRSTAHQARGGQRTAGLRHQQQTAEPAHGGGQPAEEGDDGQQRPAQREHPAESGGGSGHRPTLTGGPARAPWTGPTKVPDPGAHSVGGNNDTHAGGR